MCSSPSTNRSRLRIHQKQFAGFPILAGLSAIWAPRAACRQRLVSTVLSTAAKQKSALPSGERARCL